METVLVTGNLGYIGSILTKLIAEKGFSVIGLDTEFYGKDCELYPSDGKISKQVKKDVRDITIEDLTGVDHIIHLAALSNDPLGEFNPQLTREINFDATVRLCGLAKEAGIKRFVYASSQSMYGKAPLDEELAEDAPKYPVTEYAKTKWEAEVAIKNLASDDFIVVCMRPSTVFGKSPKLRLDIVYNNLMGSAFAKKKVEVKSDGTPWRPAIHIRDVSAAFIAGLIAPASLVNKQSFNVGIPNGNFQVKDLAEAAKRNVPGSSVTYTGEFKTADERTYRISFAKILTELKGIYRPSWTLDMGGQELFEIFTKVRLAEEDITSKKYNRLKELKAHIDSGKLDTNLRWT